MTNNSILVACRNKTAIKNILMAMSLNHDVIVKQDGASALESILLDMPSAVLLDIDIPELSASEVAKRVHRSMSQSRPTIALFGRKGDMRLRAMITHGLAHGYIEVPVSEGAFLDRFWKIVDSRLQASWSGMNEVQQALLEAGGSCVDMMTKSVTSDAPIKIDLVNDFCNSVVAAARSNDLLGLLGTLKAHNDVTFSHCLKVSSTMTIFGLGIGIRDDDLTRLAQAGLLHDIGKITISPDILLKPTEWTEQERRIVEEHPKVSLEILNRCEDLAEEIVTVAQNHHERLDGSGYPRGLKNGQVDDLSLLCAIADRYESLMEGDQNQRRLSSEDALAVMNEEAKSGLEPQFFKKFNEMVSDGVIQ